MVSGLFAQMDAALEEVVLGKVARAVCFGCRAETHVLATMGSVVLFVYSGRSATTVTARLGK